MDGLEPTKKEQARFVSQELHHAALSDVGFTARAPYMFGHKTTFGCTVSNRRDLTVDKFRYHLPLYRQHQWLIDAGFKLSRPWLTQLVQQGSQLLQPNFDAQLDSICAGHVITKDEVPVKAGATPGAASSRPSGCTD